MSSSPERKMNRLDIDRFPLRGQSLIEASAGTGKTWTINQLYRRLLLGHGEVPAPGGRRIGSGDILVVTFTRAATEELRGRIRAGIRDAFESLLAAEGATSVVTEDVSVEKALSSMPDKDVARWVKALKAQRDDLSFSELREWLQLNLTQMDEAPVNTIHAFCAQMLKRFAFDSRTGFNLAVETDSQPYLRQACEDVWRRFAYPADTATLRFLTGAYKNGPDALFMAFKGWVSKPDLTIKPAVTVNFREAYEQTQALFAEVSAQWQALGKDAIGDIIRDSGVSKKSYSKRNLPNWLDQVDDCLQGEFRLPLSDKLVKFSQEELVNKTEKGAAPEHALFRSIEALNKACSLPDQALTLELFRAVYARLLTLLDDAGVMTSDDQLRLLDEALQTEQGGHLAQQIRSLYPVAMIDEFQDTDPVQYRIFSRIYPTSEASPDYALIMIGDPKQAIYAFRGADIFTYMKARTQISIERSFTLDTNYRSHSDLIGAVNALWQNRPKPFIYDKSIEFYPVKSGGQHDKSAPVWDPGVASDHLQIWYNPEEETVDQARQRIARECAAQISAVLGGAAHFPGKTRKQTRPLVAGDLAVLVATKAEAGIIRDALTAAGIGSVFLTQKKVYESGEARDLLSILDAIANPGNETSVRRALATHAWGCRAEALVAMQQNESEWEEQLAMMHSYQQTWQRRGIMAMLMQWLEDDERAVRLRSHVDGERSLTNLIHLGELLQARSRKVRGHAALLRWLSDKVQDSDDAGDEAQLRLETDDRLVTISTIHKSKGLEYPLVFLPYLWADSSHHKGSDTTYYDGHQVVRSLAPDDKAKEAAVRDQKAERLRLLYVALTRARYGCYVWISGAKINRKVNWPTTALGYLLNTEDLSTLDLPGIYIGSIPQWTAGLQAELDVPPPPVTAARVTGQWRDNWRVGSYSGLAAQSGHDASHSSSHTSADTAEQAGADLSQTLDLDAAAPSAQVLTQPPESLPLPLTFPKGVNPGTCLHSLFEDWDFTTPEQLLSLCEERLPLYGLGEQPAADVAQWLTAIVQQPFLLYDTTACLADIRREQRLDEMEFYLPVGNLTPAAVESLLGSRDGEAARFHFEPLTGYLKGFIDLIFEWQGRYYVADYKSNYLGDQPQDYRPQSLRESMRDHRYDLQSWIYLVALDQLLSQRLPDYDPHKHLGGSVYLYLRGMGDHFTGPEFEGDIEGVIEGTDLGVCFTPVSQELLRQWRATLLTKDNAEASV